jgi:hypothetical protein
MSLTITGLSKTSPNCVRAVKNGVYRKISAVDMLSHIAVMKGITNAASSR